MEDQISAPATLERFHLGISADGSSCLLLFIDDQKRAIGSVASLSEFRDLIQSLQQAANEMARRRELSDEDLQSAAASDLDDADDELTIAGASFRMNPVDDCMEGALIGASGEIVKVRLRPDVASELTRSLLLTTPAASAC